MLILLSVDYRTRDARRRRRRRATRVFIIL